VPQGVPRVQGERGRGREGGGGGVVGGVGAALCMRALPRLCAQPATQNSPPPPPPLPYRPFPTQQECAKRIESDTTGEAHCTGWYYDYYRCVDKCAAPKLWASLK
jgi:ubiquinol-cytochrome c reductase subunit 6